MRPLARDPDRERRFAVLYNTAYTDVLRFVRRRSPLDVAEDLAHDAFLIAWHRFDQVPRDPDGARAWLFTTARNCILANYRTRQRYEQLGIRIADSTPHISGEDASSAAFRLDLIAAWKTLPPAQQEVLALALWEQLPAKASGQVLGISAAAYRVRLHRARTALRAALGGEPSLSPTAIAPQTAVATRPSATTTEMTA
ncbi:sigma-70 family RNA polymerase sigma factor [Plantibacter sp. VKM Ac-2880]|uniref:RNA polymerase sigma factor n=1 Tax=Plantibacter sp. VKM Ac-2880 TaxID=2783827 RepID=UPI00188EDB1F|nr:sigma-70 family RNA polymerase sigma factor [Plantibacter sp. VKM Ac-2880]MBF4570849.1 sigma-70 family RNA polymerase sigma factor [Plantibacter sp. VKM Ac-2880]